LSSEADGRRLNEAEEEEIKKNTDKREKKININNF